MPLGNLLQARLQTCDWSGYDESVRQVEQLLSAGKRVCLPGRCSLFHTRRMHSCNAPAYS